MSNVPRVQFTPEGLILPSESDILNGVLADMDAAFGGGLNITTLSTPQAQLATSLTQIIGETNNLFALYVNQVNPDFASGFMQDAVARIYFLTRKQGVPTTVTCTCIGLPGVVIRTGSQVISDGGVIYEATQTGVIPAGGSVDIIFAATINGAIACPPNTVNEIYKAITGWDTVNNTIAGVEGSSVESRAEFAFRREQSVALNAHGSLQSIYAEVFAQPDVLDVFVTENVTNVPIDFGSTNYTLAPHSLYVAATGGTDTDIANAIWLKKDVGCDYNGNTSVIVVDDIGYALPYPQYEVKFERPIATQTFFSVVIQDNPSVPSNIVQLTKEAILRAFNGSNGAARARIGSDLFASRFYGWVSLISPAIQIVSIKVGLTATPTSDSITYGIDQAPTLAINDILVTLI